MRKMVRDNVAQPIVILSDDSEDTDEEVSRKCDDIIIVENTDSPVRLVISPPFRLVIVAGLCKLNLVVL